MQTMSDGEYLKRITTLSDQELRNYVDTIYDALCIKFGKRASFGYNGCKEFVASLFLADHDSTTTSEVLIAIKQVFDGVYNPLDFSNKMDSIVTRSNIEYSTWSSAYRYLHFNHNWLENHPCGL